MTARQEKQLLDRVTTEIEKWVKNPDDPLFGLYVIIERDVRGSFPTLHIRCKRGFVERKKTKTPTA